MKRIIPVFLGLLVLVAPPGMQAQFEYTPNYINLTAAITGYYGPGGAVTIPAIYNGYTINAIMDPAFFGVSSLTSVSIPSTVIYIDAGAFLECNNLTAITVSEANSFYSSGNGILFDKSQATLLQFPGGLGGSYTIPAGVTTLAADAFLSNTNLTSITIPSNVTNISGGALNGCLSLTAITVDPQNSFYSSSNGVLFDKSQSTLVLYPAGQGASYAIPGNVINIGNDAFSICLGLTNVTIPASAISIGAGAFENCVDLTNVTIPASVTNIGESAYFYCPGLTGVFFMGNAPAFGADCFQADPNVKLYYLPGTAGWSNTIAGVPAVLWNPFIQTGDGRFGVNGNQFGFNITGTTNIPIVVEACTNLAGPAWNSLTNVTLTNGVFYFSEPLQANSFGRFYRISAP